MPEQRPCGACRFPHRLLWEPDERFGPGAEVIRCPRCGRRWGVRTRRQGVPAAPPVDPPEERAAQGEPSVVVVRRAG
jgi:hypothetical protein